MNDLTIRTIIIVAEVPQVCDTSIPSGENTAVVAAGVINRLVLLPRGSFFKVAKHSSTDKTKKPLAVKTVALV